MASCYIFWFRLDRFDVNSRDDRLRFLVERACPMLRFAKEHKILLKDIYVETSVERADNGVYVINKLYYAQSVAC
jgi:hypothetical protein